MTPEQISSIISAMPEGKRKRACVALSDLDYPIFWELIKSRKYGEAAGEILGLSPEIDILADMIWEGGA